MAHNNDPNATPPPRPSRPSGAGIPPSSTQSPPMPPYTPRTQAQPSIFPTSSDRKFDLKDENGKLLGKAKIKTITSGTTTVPILYVSPKRWYTKKDKWHTYLQKTDNPSSDLVWKIDKSKGGNEQLLKVKPFWMTAYRERKLTDMYLLLAKRENSLNSAECKDLVERANSNDFGRAGRKVRTGVAAGSMIVAAGAIASNEFFNHSLGKLVEQYFGHTITNNIPGETVKVPPTAQDIKNASHAKLLKEVYTDLGNLVNATDDLKIFDKYKGVSDVNDSALSTLSAKIKINKPMWTTYQTALKAMGKTEAGLYSLPISEIVKLANQVGYTQALADAHGLLYNQMKAALSDTNINLSALATPTLEHLLGLETLAIKDPTADLLWTNYAAELNASYNITVKDDLYTKTPIELVQLANTIAEEHGGAAWQAVVNAHITYLATAKSVISDKAYTDTEIDNAWGGVSLENITALNEKITLTPEINSVFGDTYVADYFSHTGLTMKGAYTDKDLQSKVNKGFEYKFFAKQYDKNLTADKILEMPGEARVEALNSLDYIAQQWNWKGGNYSKNTSDNRFEEAVRTNATLSYDAKSKMLELCGIYYVGGAEIKKTADGAFVQAKDKDGKILLDKDIGSLGGYQISEADYNILKNL